MAISQVAMACSGVAPPPITELPGTTSARSPGMRATSALGAGADLVGRLPDHGQRRHRVPAFQQQVAQVAFERLADELVQPQRAEQRIAPQARDDLRLPGEDAGLRPAQQLIAAERDQVDAGLQTVGDQRLVNAERPQIHHASAAQVFIHRQMPRSRPSATSSRKSTRAVKPDMRKLLGWTRSSRRVRSPMAAR